MLTMWLVGLCAESLIGWGSPGRPVPAGWTCLDQDPNSFTVRWA